MQATTLLKLNTSLERVDTFQGLWRQAEDDIRHSSSLADKEDIDTFGSMYDR